MFHMFKKNLCHSANYPVSMLSGQGWREWNCDCHSTWIFEQVPETHAGDRQKVRKKDTFTCTEWNGEITN